MSPRKTVHVVAQRIEPEPIKVAGFPLFKQLAVAEMSEQAIRISDLREPLAASGQHPLADGLRLAQTGRGSRKYDEIKGRQLGEQRQVLAQVGSERAAGFKD
jgi:hypothetical protein